MRAHLEAIGRISQTEALLSGDVDAAARLITETAARAVGCERVNIWLFDDEETELRCIDAYEASSGRHASGMVLREDQYAAEFHAIKTSAYVNADDPLTDPRTAGYVDGYVRPLRITSMLDAVIQASGRHFGLLCFEHVNRPHHWEQDEIAFACQLADKVALALVNRARRQAEANLRAREEKYRRLVESTTDYIWQVDASGVFTYVSPRMTERLGCRPGEPMSDALWSALARVVPRAAPTRAAAVPHPFSLAETTVPTADGRPLVLESSGTAVFDAAGLFSGYRGISRDVTQRSETTLALKYRDTVLHAVMTSAAELVAGAALAESLPRALEIVGRAINVERVLVYRLMHEGGACLAEAWHARGGPHGTPPGAGLMRGSDIGGWLEPLVAGGAVTLCGDMPGPPANGLMQVLGTQSLALVPVTVSGRRWGCILVDDRGRNRQWTSIELDSLRTLSEVIGSLLAREAAQAALRQSELTFRTVTEAALDGILMFDGSGIVRFWNAAAERILGYTAAEAVGTRLDEWLVTPAVGEVSGDPDEACTAPASMRGQTVEMAARRRDGAEIPIELSVAPMEIGSDRFAVAILRDISERKRAEAEMHRMARFDGLTGLANRGHFVDALQHAIARARRNGTAFAVHYLDIDHFKDINDTLGHPIGDRLLQLVAARLRSRIREVDTLARFGGDEFAILQTGVEDAADAAVLAGTLLDLLAQPFLIEGNEIRTAASVGITLAGDDQDVEALLAHADIALYRAKAEGRGTFRFFTEAMDAEVRTRVTLSTELRHAIGAGELFLLYQPQVELDTGRVVGVEALLRWKHPRRGVLRPNEFIAAAESSGLIVALGEWVLSAACRQARDWLDAGIAPDVVALNVSALQFRAPLELERSINLALADSGFPPERLELELTETALMEASRDHSDMLRRLRGRRIRLSIDDFGTGYSSLDYLRRFPVHRIKIAQSFVSGMSSRPENAAIVKAALGLTRELGLGVIAEGVESGEERDLLRAWGCPQAQGNHFSEPLPVEAVTRLLRWGRLVPEGAESHRAAAQHRAAQNPAVQNPAVQHRTSQNHPSRDPASQDVVSQEAASQVAARAAAGPLVFARDSR